jgi:hypothetical protein
MFEWFKKIFGGKKQEVATPEVPTSAPEASEMPMNGEAPEEKNNNEEIEETGSEEMK